MVKKYLDIGKIAVASFALIFPLLLPVSQAQAEESQENIGISTTDIKIGASYPQTGGPQPYFYSSFFSGANSYFDYLNQAGGIYGRKVYLISGDDQGLPTRSITATNDLLLKSRVFALFNSSPTTPTHAAMSSVLRNREIPDFYPTAIYSGFRSVNKYPNLIAMGTSTQQEARIAATFARDYFPGKSFTWRSNLPDGDIELDVKKAWSGMGFTVKPFTNDSSTGTIHLSLQYPLMTSAYKPLIMSGRLVSYTSRMVVFDPNELIDTYAIFQLPAVSEKGDEFIKFFESLSLKYANGAPFDNAFVEGANSAYVFAQALAATGPSLTRKGLIEAFRNGSNTFSTASYGALDFGTGVTAGRATFYVAKFDGSSWSRVSDYYTNELDSNLVTKGLVSRTKLLPNGLPLMNVKFSTTSISCVKGKEVKLVKGTNSKCPAGYKKK
jgi:ABC-type branched-subunit amino acid transport system substrate-binding protein